MITALLTVCDENVFLAATCLRMLYLASPEVDWLSELDSAARQWQPFISRGLSIDAWLDMVNASL